MDPLQSGFWQKLKASRFSFSLVTLATLALGILIGTVVTYGVKGKTIDSSDAQQLDCSSRQFRRFPSFDVAPHHRECPG